MKTLLKSLKLTIIVSLILGAISAFAGRDGGGGDPLAQEFVKSGWLAYFVLSAGVKVPEVSVDLDSFKDFLGRTEVESTKKQVLFKGMDKCAVYDGAKNHILVNRKCFKGIDAIHRRDLAMHEYFRAMGKDDNNYQASAKVSAYLEATSLFPVTSYTKDETQIRTDDQVQRARYSPLEGRFRGVITLADGTKNEAELDLALMNVTNSNPSRATAGSRVSLVGGLNICLDKPGCFENSSDQNISNIAAFDAVSFDSATGSIILSLGDDNFYKKSSDVVIGGTVSPDFNYIHGQLHNGLKSNVGYIDLQRVK